MKNTSTHYTQKIGDLIEKERLRQNISSKELCRGLCNVSTYTRYKYNQITPDLLTLTALCDRLGFNIDDMYIACSEKEYLIVKKRTEIIYTAKVDSSKVSALLDNYSNMKVKRGKTLCNQFILLCKGILNINDIPTATNYFQKAALLTNLDINTISTLSRLHDLELEIWIRLDELNDFQQLEQIYDYLDNLNDNNILKKKYFGHISYTLANKLYETNDIEKSLLITTKAIEYKRKIFQLKHFNILLELKNKLTNEELSDSEKYILYTIESINFINNEVFKNLDEQL